MLELCLINEFREVVNKNNFTYFRYSNNRNKNQWNCICSAMDWITVAVEHLADYPKKRAGNLGSIENSSSQVMVCALSPSTTAWTACASPPTTSRPSGI